MILFLNQKKYFKNFKSPYQDYYKFSGRELGFFKVYNEKNNYFKFQITDHHMP